MNGTVKLSMHSIERLEERYGICEIDACYVTAERVWRNGKNADCFTGPMKKLLLGIKHRHSSNTVLKVHSKSCFIFDNSGMLITAYEIHNYDKYMNTLKPYEKDNYWELAA